MKLNRIEFAKLKIYEYVDQLFTCICDLCRKDFEEFVNTQSHGLEKQELIVLLYELFSDYKLVAKSETRGLFTPSLEEIESALEEENDFEQRSKNTYYGLTSGAVEEYSELKRKNCENA